MRLFSEYEKPERSLIIRPPYIQKILDNHKTLEMRSRCTSIRGRIGLIEAGSGFIVGEADLWDCGNALSGLEARALIDYHQIDNYELLKKWCYPWRLRNVVRYSKPIPYKHPRGAVIWVKHYN